MRVSVVLLCLAVSLAHASPIAKNRQKKSVLSSLGLKSIEADSKAIGETAIVGAEGGGSAVARAKKQTTFCIEIKQNEAQKNPCEEHKIDTAVVPEVVTPEPTPETTTTTTTEAPTSPRSTPVLVAPQQQIYYVPIHPQQQITIPAVQPVAPEPQQYRPQENPVQYQVVEITQKPQIIEIPTGNCEHQGQGAVAHGLQNLPQNLNQGQGSIIPGQLPNQYQSGLNGISTCQCPDGSHGVMGNLIRTVNSGVNTGLNVVNSGLNSLFGVNTGLGTRSLNLGGIDGGLYNKFGQRVCRHNQDKSKNQDEETDLAKEDTKVV